MRKFSRFHVIALLTVLLTVVACAGYWAALVSSHERLRRESLVQLGDRAGQLAGAIGEQTRALIQGIDFTAAELADEYPAHKGDSFDQHVRMVTSHFPAGAVVQVAVIEADGYLAYSNLGLKERVYLGDREHFRAHADAPGQEHLFISKPVLGRVSRVWSIQFSRPIRSQGKFVGVVVLSLSPEYLYNNLVRLDLPREDVISIFRQDGSYLSRSRNLADALGKSTPAERPFVGPDAPTRGSISVPAAFDQVQRIYAWRRLEGFPIVTVVGLSERAFLEPVEQSIADARRNNAFGLTVVLLLSFGIALLLLRFGRQQAAVVESEEQLRLLLNSAGEGIYGVDTEGRCTFCNPAALRLLGYERADQLLGQNMHQLTHHSRPDGSPHPVADCRICEAFSTGRGSQVDDDVFWRADGALLSVEYSSFPQWREGQIIGTVVVFNDISGRKKAEQEIRDLNAGLEQRVRDRTATLEQAIRDLESFSYTTSHDLRAPLRAINGYARLLLDNERPQLSTDGQHMLDRIAQNASRLGDLIDDVLEYSRLGRLPLNRTSIDLGSLVASAAEELKQSYPRTQVRAANLPLVLGDRTMLHQVLQNLIENGCKFSNGREEPLVEVEATEEEGGETVFSVRDNGVGFDMRYAEKLFGMFQRLHPGQEFAGTGVGLAIAKRLIERHGGRIWAEAEPGRGATFRFTLGPESLPRAAS